MKGMQKAMEAYEQEMQEILTEKQYEEFQIMRRKRLKRMRQRRRMMGEEEGFR
jgi:Tfp pilus assembly protein PilV